MTDKEQKTHKIHRVLIILTVVLGIALLFELKYERSKFLEERLNVRLREKAYSALQADRDAVGFFKPEIDLTETESGYIITVNLPGINKDEIEVTLKGNYLTINARRDLNKIETSDLTGNSGI